MNQFTTTAIINSLDAFKKAFNVDPKHVCEVFEHMGCWGRKEEIKVDLNTLDFASLKTDTHTPEVIRFEVRLNTVGAEISMFQNALTRNAELFTYEVKYGNADVMAKAFEKAVKNQRNTSKNFDFDAKADGETITLTAGADFIRFKEININEVSTNLTGYEAQNNIMVYNGDIVKGIAEIKPGMNGFGDTAWLLNNFKLPTYVNTNWLAIYQDERPVPGKLYNQITVHAIADRGELTGMGAVGQVLRSKTTHVFYVIDGQTTTDVKDFLISVCPELKEVKTVGNATNIEDTKETESYVVKVNEREDKNEDGLIAESEITETEQDLVTTLTPEE